MKTATYAQAGSIAAVSGRLFQAALLALVGATLVYVAGFAQPDILHNTAHDARHAFATPCH